LLWSVAQLVNSIQGESGFPEDASQIPIAMPANVGLGKGRVTGQGGADELTVEGAQSFNRKVTPRKLGGNQDFSFIGEGPGSGVEKFMQGRFEAEAVVDGIGSAKGVPLDVGSFAAEVVTAQGGSKAGEGALVLVGAQDSFSEFGIALWGGLVSTGGFLAFGWGGEREAN
jgi:hypothetical protein